MIVNNIHTYKYFFLILKVINLFVCFYIKDIYFTVKKKKEKKKHEKFFNCVVLLQSKKFNNLIIKRNFNIFFWC
jgi:hypothetical protein